ncbi:MAG: FAD-dependent oxidoreductase [Chloroflexota bacterium]
MHNDPLFQPFQLKHLTLKNRIMSTSHAPAYADDAMPKEQYQLYHEEKAKGGIGLTMFGGSSTVDIDSPASFGQLDVSHDRVIPYFQQMADRVHKHGAALMCQITHMGRRTMWDLGEWLPTVAPSAVREHAHRSFPKAMEDFDIERIIKAYGAAALRCQEGGLDGIEISAHTPHLLDSFWTPTVNLRTDEWGGSLENRMRFGMEVIQEVRRQVGDDYIVGIRLSGDQMLQGGLGHDECVKIVQILAATGLLDFFNVTKGNGITERALTNVIPTMGMPSASALDVASAIKAKADVTVFHATRITSVSTARHAIREGMVDLVAMTRAHIADPHLANKTMRGEEDQIRPCVGANYCIDQIYIGGQAVCLHNPATGREAKIPHAIPKSDNPGRKVVVVGAGPSGLEAARVCAERGHHVTLFEAAPQPGGQVRLASQVERRADLIGITDWLYGQVQKLGVTVHFNRYVSSEDVQTEQPDVVIVATGGEPNVTFLGTGAELVDSTWDVLGGYAKVGETVLLFDDNGRHPGISCAEFMAEKGAAVEIVTPDRMVGHDIHGTNHPGYMQQLYKHKVTLTPDHRLVEVVCEGDKSVATLHNEFTDETIDRWVDQVVVEHGTLPVDELYMELRPNSSNGGEVDLHALVDVQPQTIVRNPAGNYQLFRVGDAVASRNIHAAIYDSLRLCVVL